MGVSNYGVASLSGYRAKVDRLFLRLSDTELPLVVRVVGFSQHKSTRMLLRSTNSLFDGWIYSLLLLFLIQQRQWRLLLASSLGVIICFIAYLIAKPRLQRIRPCHLAIERAIPSRCLDRYSFPSGHCMTLTVLGVLLCWSYHAFIPILLYMLLLLCWARMAAAHHYPSDLIAGVAIGLFVALPLAITLL